MRVHVDHEALEGPILSRVVVQTRREAGPFNARVKRCTPSWWSRHRVTP